MSDDSQNSSRNYVHEVIQPKKHQITASALKYLQKFIQEVFEPKKEVIETDVKLSLSEKRVLAHLASGLNTKETADIMGVKLSTVQSYVSRVYGKYGVKDRRIAIEKYLKEKEG